KFPEFKDKEVITLNQNDFREMFRLTVFAVSHEESRYVLNGVLLEIKQKQVRLVATDGRRLAKIEKIIETTGSQEISVILPTKAVIELMRNLKEEGLVSFVVGNNQVLFDIAGTLIATRVIDGDFPNYNQVVPKESDIKVKVNSGEFLAAIRRANLLATPDFQAIKF
ncbi:MAG: DNA polymerase III subunit beta, partial [Candidatus Omnitrophica bacterium]|nr:DNA polymerase III subunit beta [Candidatus Omnitrophota bacterium]